MRSQRCKRKSNIAICNDQYIDKSLKTTVYYFFAVKMTLSYTFFTCRPFVTKISSDTLNCRF